MVLDNVSKIQTSIYACGIFSPTLGQYESQKYTFHNRGNCKIRAVKVMHTQKTHIPCQRQLKNQGRSRIKDVRKLQCYETEMCKISDFQERCFFEMYVFDGFSKKQCFNFLLATQYAKYSFYFMLKTKNENTAKLKKHITNYFFKALLSQQQGPLNLKGPYVEPELGEFYMHDVPGRLSNQGGRLRVVERDRSLKLCERGGIDH